MIISERSSGTLGSWTGPPMQQVALPGEYTLALHDSIDELGSLFENSTLGVAIADSAFRFLTANPAFLAMLGYSNEELQQLSFLDICMDETPMNVEFLYTSCVKARGFDMRSKHGANAKMEPICQSTHTFLPLADARHSSWRFLW